MNPNLHITVRARIKVNDSVAMFASRDLNITSGTITELLVLAVIVCW